MNRIKKQLVCLLAALILLCCGTAFAEEAANFEAAYYDSVLRGLLANYRFEADTEAIARAVAEAVLPVA